MDYNPAHIGRPLRIHLKSPEARRLPPPPSLRGEFWFAGMESGEFYVTEDRGLNWLRLGKINGGVSNANSMRATMALAEINGSIYAPAASEGLFLLEWQEASTAASLISLGP